MLILCLICCVQAVNRVALLFPYLFTFSVSTCPGPDGSKYFIHREPDMNQTYHTHFERCTIGFDSRLPASMDIPCLQQILTQSLANEPEKGFRSIFLHGTSAGHVLIIDDDGAFTATTLSSDQRDEVFPGATHKVCMPFCQQTVSVENNLDHPRTNCVL